MARVPLREYKSWHSRSKCVQLTQTCHWHISIWNIKNWNVLSVMAARWTMVRCLWSNFVKRVLLSGLRSSRSSKSNIRNWRSSQRNSRNRSIRKLSVWSLMLILTRSNDWKHRKRFKSIFQKSWSCLPSWMEFRSCKSMIKSCQLWRRISRRARSSSSISRLKKLQMS